MGSGGKVAVQPFVFMLLFLGNAYGCRDRSWGVRPVGEPEVGAPGALPQLFWMWAPIHLKDRGAMFCVEGEEWGMADLDPMEFKHLHAEQVCRIHWGDEEAVGVLEQFVIGEHKPTPFTGFVDPYEKPE